MQRVYRMHDHSPTVAVNRRWPASPSVARTHALCPDTPWPATSARHSQAPDPRSARSPSPGRTAGFPADPRLAANFHIVRAGGSEAVRLRVGCDGAHQQPTARIKRHRRQLPAALAILIQPDFLDHAAVLHDLQVLDAICAAAEVQLDRQRHRVARWRERRGPAAHH